MLRRHMSYANIVATMALVFAMGGGAAYAASHYLITNTKQIKPSVLAQLKGKAGANGANGAPGSQGPAGPAGPQGSPGANGSNGEPGKPGESVTNKKVEPGATCKEGGAEFKVGAGTPTKACNGEKGVLHAGETLPAGATETGTWAVRGTVTASGEVKVTTISFPIPLKSAPNAEFVTLANKTKAACPGGVTKPEAAEGTLCVFAGESQVHAGKPEAEGFAFFTFANPEGVGGGANAGKAGVELLLTSAAPETPGEELSAEGTWAVTG